MTKNILFLLALLLSVSALRAQDLILTQSGDSINCKITKIADDYIYFTFKKDKEFRSSLISKTEVDKFIPKYYKMSQQAQSQLPNYSAQDMKQKRLYKRTRFELNGGLSYLTAKTSSAVPADFKNYIRDLKSGYHFGASFHLFSSENLGWGLQYKLFRTTNSLDNIYLTTPDGSTKYGKMADNVTTQYIGPTVCWRFTSSNEKLHYIYGFSLGYLSYTDDAVLVDSFLLKGTTVGMVLNLGLDYTLTDKSALNIGIGMLSGTLTKMKVTQFGFTQTVSLPKESYESMSRIDISVGLTF